MCFFHSSHMQVVILINLPNLIEISLFFNVNSLHFKKKMVTFPIFSHLWFFRICSLNFSISFWLSYIHAGVILKWQAFQLNKNWTCWTTQISFHWQLHLVPKTYGKLRTPIVQPKFNCMLTSLILWLIKSHVEMRFEQNYIQDCWKYGWNSHLRCSNNLPSPKRRALLLLCSTSTSNSHSHVTSSSLTLPLCGSSSGANLIHKFSTKLLMLLLHNVLLVQQAQPTAAWDQKPTRAGVRCKGCQYVSYSGIT